MCRQNQLQMSGPEMRGSAAVGFFSFGLEKSREGGDKRRPTEVLEIIRGIS